MNVCRNSVTEWGPFLSQTLQGFDTERIVKDFPFSAPIGKSLEQLCEQLKTERFYINDVKNIKLLDRVLYSRYIGAGYKIMQFEPIDIRKELNALWFERNSEPIIRSYMYERHISHE
jgi:hypothetical protein